MMKENNADTFSKNSSQGDKILSVCLPVYNGGEVLKYVLQRWVREIEQFQDRVELVVSDNCSTDDTEKTVRRAMETFPLRFYRQERNIGAHNNFFLLASELARGKFVWLTGHDDLIIPGSLQTVVSILETDPDLEFVYVNYGMLEGRTPEGSVDWNSTKTRCPWSVPPTGPLKHLGQMMADYEECFGFISSSIMRRNHAAEAMKAAVGKDLWDGPEAIMGHAIYIIRHLWCARSYCISEPLIQVGPTECRAWPVGPVFEFRYKQCLYDLLQSRGVSGRIIRHYKRKKLDAAFLYLWHMWCVDEITSETFLLTCGFVRQNWWNMEMWQRLAAFLWSVATVRVWGRLKPMFRQ